MAALATRAFGAAGGDCYLCPLSETPVSRALRRELLQPVFAGTRIPLAQVAGLIAKGAPLHEIAADYPELSRADLHFAAIQSPASAASYSFAPRAASFSAGDPRTLRVVAHNTRPDSSGT